MKINLDAAFVDAEDKTALENDKPITLKDALKRAVLSDVDGKGDPIKAEDKVKRFDLFLKLKTADANTDFSIDEVALLDKASLVFPTLIAGQIHYLLSK